MRKLKKLQPVESGANPQAASPVEAPKARCSIQMANGKPCGREVHSAPEGCDEVPVCLMHSLDPAKAEPKLNKSFQRQIDAILTAAGPNSADFTQFVFLCCDYHKHQFLATCRFKGARFARNADFQEAKFTNGANFTNATFTHDANFTNATFSLGAHFPDALFAQKAEFGSTAFNQGTNFTNSKFIQNANFKNAVFTQNAHFRSALFTQNAEFESAEFIQAAIFTNATFNEEAHFQKATFRAGSYFDRTIFTKNCFFTNATFTQSANFTEVKFMLFSDFTGANFTENAEFWQAMFCEYTEFGYATFTQTVSFTQATFAKQVSFLRSEFLSAAEFRETKFLQSNPKEPGPNFHRSVFLEPDRVTFFKTDLSHALFHDCDVSNINFKGVKWPRRKGSGKRMVFEELVTLSHLHTISLRLNEDSPEKRDYRLIAEIYQQLKKNYDEHKDYETAGDFHYGEMEMRRLTQRTGKFATLRTWWHRNLSFTAWYKYASEYGENLQRPLFGVVLTLVLFSALFPCKGLRYDPSKDGDAPRTVPTEVISYSHPTPTTKPWLTGPKAELQLVADSFLTSIEVAAFQKDQLYTPAYRTGRLLALFETLITSSLLALFLLALRRHYKR
jgi:hypothetical protein